MVGWNRLVPCQPFFLKDNKKYFAQKLTTTNSQFFNKTNIMAKFDKLAVLKKIGETGMVPVFYDKDAEVAKNVVRACYDGGVRAFEFTNRGDFAHEVFEEVVKFAAVECPEMALGVGSVVDPANVIFFNLIVTFL